MSLLGDIADDAFLAARHASKGDLSDADRAALGNARTALASAIEDADRSLTRRNTVRRMAPIVAAVALVDEAEEVQGGSDIEALIDIIDRALTGKLEPGEPELMAKVFERIALVSLDVADDLLRSNSSRGQWSPATSNF